jgi:hypothetical protein
MTSNFWKCVRAKVDLPEPEAPIKTTRENSGIVSFIMIDIDDCQWLYVYVNK